MIEKFRSWLSIELMSLAIKTCPYAEMRDLLRESISEAVDRYFDDDS